MLATCTFCFGSVSFFYPYCLLFFCAADLGALFLKGLALCPGGIIFCCCCFALSRCPARGIHRHAFFFFFLFCRFERVSYRYFVLLRLRRGVSSSVLRVLSKLTLLLRATSTHPFMHSCQARLVLFWAKPTVMPGMYYCCRRSHAAAPRDTHPPIHASIRLAMFDLSWGAP